MKWMTNFGDLPFNNEMEPPWLKYMNSVLSELIEKSIEITAAVYAVEIRQVYL